MCGPLWHVSIYRRNAQEAGDLRLLRSSAQWRRVDYAMASRGPDQSKTTLTAVKPYIPRQQFRPRGISLFPSVTILPKTRGETGRALLHSSAGNGCPLC